MVKLVDAIRQEAAGGRNYFGFEFFCPTSEYGLVSLYDRIERLSALDPLFCGITWGDYGATADTSIEVAGTSQSLLSINFQVTLTGYTSTRTDMRRWLAQIKGKGVRNLLLTRGHRVPLATEPSDFPHAVDLVRFVRQEFGDYFGIAVVCAPEPVEHDLETEVGFLKQKVDAGADFVITEPVFDAAKLHALVQLCRQRGIACPILPGVMVVPSARHLDTLSAVGARAGVRELRDRLEAAGAALARQNTEPATPAAATAAATMASAETRRVAVSFYQNLVQTLVQVPGVGGAYFFTLNSETLMAPILNGIKVIALRPFPWKPSENEERRRQETVRPIHWSSRITSYMARTAQWASFKEGRKGVWQGIDSGGYHAKLLLRSRAKRCAQFSALTGIQDISEGLAALSSIFIQFLQGHGTLPWAEEVSGETALVIDSSLKPLNARGLFTINSQPAVNGAPSTDRTVGWGPAGGMVYQKNYVEFFCPPSHAQTVLQTLASFPSLQYLCMDRAGQLLASRWSGGADAQTRHGAAPAAAASPTSPVTPLTPAAATPTAAAATPGAIPQERQQPIFELFGEGVTVVTWGVFPGREVVQPTIVSISTLRDWVGEAFDLWSAPFPSHDVPPVVQMIQSDWVLFCIVDNDYFTVPRPLEVATAEVCSKIPTLVGADLPVTSPITAGAAPASH